MRFLFFVSFLLLPGITHAQGKAPIVFIHGIEGSILENAQGERAWLTVPAALGLSTPDLRLPLTHVSHVQQGDGLHATAPLEDVSLLRGLVGQEVYGPFLQGMRAANTPVYAFAYDWRRDNLETVALFDRFVQNVRQAHGGPVRLVAHSMGGLIGLVLMNQHPEYFQDAVFAGVPFRGGVGFLVDLHAGARIGLNGDILAPEVMFTFPSVYGFFPLDGAGLLTANGTPLPMDFFSAAQWRAQELGMFAPGRKGARLPSPSDAESFLTWALARAKAFRSLLVAAPVPYPPIRVVSSQHTPTLMRLIRQGPQSVLGWDFETAAKEPGDGRVSFDYSLPYAGIAHQLLLSDAAHSQLLNDPAIIAAVAAPLP